MSSSSPNEDRVAPLPPQPIAITVAAPGGSRRRSSFSSMGAFAGFSPVNPNPLVGIGPSFGGGASTSSGSQGTVFAGTSLGGSAGGLSLPFETSEMVSPLSPSAIVQPRTAVDTQFQKIQNQQQQQQQQQQIPVATATTTTGFGPFRIGGFSLPSAPPSSASIPVPMRNVSDTKSTSPDSTTTAVPGTSNAITPSPTANSAFGLLRRLSMSGGSSTTTTTTSAPATSGANVTAVPTSHVAHRAQTITGASVSASSSSADQAVIRQTGFDPLDHRLGSVAANAGKAVQKTSPTSQQQQQSQSTQFEHAKSTSPQVPKSTLTRPSATITASPSSPKSGTFEHAVSHTRHISLGAIDTMGTGTLPSLNEMPELFGLPRSLKLNRRPTAPPKRPESPMQSAILSGQFID